MKALVRETLLSWNHIKVVKGDVDPFLHHV